MDSTATCHRLLRGGRLRVVYVIDNRDQEGHPRDVSFACPTCSARVDMALTVLLTAAFMLCSGRLARAGTMVARQCPTTGHAREAPAKLHG
jgi:hypothetical protein